MMNQPLMISSLIRHADKNHGDTEIVSRTVEGSIHRYNYHEAHVRARRLARALERLGVVAGDRAGAPPRHGPRPFARHYPGTRVGGGGPPHHPPLFSPQA